MNANNIVVGLVCLLGAACGPKVYPLEKVAVKASAEQELIARGQYLVNGPMHCAECHGTKMVNGSFQTDFASLTGGMEHEMGPLGTLRFPNITSDQETGIGGWSDEDIARIVKHAQRPDGTVSPFMRLASTQPADDDLVAVVSYVRSLQPVKHQVKRSEMSFLGNMILGGVAPRAAAAPTTAPAMAPTVERGAYLVKVAHCVGCHSEQDGFDIKAGTELGGASEPMPSVVPGDTMKFLPPNLTPHATGLRTRWSEEQFIARFKAGRAFKGSPMAWNSFQNITDDDLKAIWAYLGTVKPVDRETSVTAIAE